MTSIERNDLMPTQKLEWVTPKISLMDAEDTEGNKRPGAIEGATQNNGFTVFGNS